MELLLRWNQETPNKFDQTRWTCELVHAIIPKIPLLKVNADAAEIKLVAGAGWLPGELAKTTVFGS